MGSRAAWCPGQTSSLQALGPIPGLSQADPHPKSLAWGTGGGHQRFPVLGGDPGRPPVGSNTPPPAS